MSTETAPAASSAPAPKAPRAPRTGPPQSYTKTLTDGKDQLIFTALVRKGGKVGVYATHRVVNQTTKKTDSSTRGASSEHENMDSAKAEIDKGVKAALKAGWQENSTGGGGYTARPDSFNLASLPKPGARK